MVQIFQYMFVFDSGHNPIGSHMKISRGSINSSAKHFVIIKTETFTIKIIADKEFLKEHFFLTNIFGKLTLQCKEKKGACTDTTT